MITIDVCGTGGSPIANLSGSITSPGYPSPYAADVNCELVLQPPAGSRLRLRFDVVDLREGSDMVVVRNQDGIETTVMGTTLPKDFIGSQFSIMFSSDSVNNNGTGFSLSYDAYPREEIQLKSFLHEVDLQAGKPLHLHSNDYPTLYDDDTYYMWNVTSSVSNYVVFTLLDMDTEMERDWLDITAHKTDGQREVLFHESGTTETRQISVQDFAYVTVEFRADYSRNGRGFHILAESDSGVDGIIFSQNDTINCGGNFFLGDMEMQLEVTDNIDIPICVWAITNNVTGSRIDVVINDLDLEMDVDFFEVFHDASPGDGWGNYRRRLTGQASNEHVYIEEGDGVWMVLYTGSASYPRRFDVTVRQVQDFSCNGELDLNGASSGEIQLGNFTDLSTVYCQWLVKTPFLTNVNVRVASLVSERMYDKLEIGSGSDPTAIGSRQKLITGDMDDETFSTYGGDLWITFTAADAMPGDNIEINLAFDDAACGIETLLDLSGTIMSPMLEGGLYPNDADCQWIVQVRGGFQVRLHFVEFDLEYGHDRLLIGGTTPHEDDVDSTYLVLTGSEMPYDVISRFNGLNLRFVSDGSARRTGFSLTYEEFFTCPEGYEYNPANETCYKFVTTPTPWFNARYDCDNVADGDLVVINDQAENDYVMNKMRSLQNNSIWIGFYDAAIYGQWAWVDCAESSDFGNSRWELGTAPSNTSSNGRNYAYMSTETGLYGNDVWTTERPYVCEITRKNYVDSDCYPSNFRVTSVDSREVALSFDLSPYLCDVAGYNMRYNTSGSYVEMYIDGALTDSVVVSNLDPFTTYLFEIIPCTISFGCYGYSTALSVLATTTCPVNYEEGPTGHCYRFRLLDYGSWWSTGRRTCDNEADSDLVIINDQVEIDYLRQRTTELNSNMTWWIGYSDQSVEGDWRWVDCSSATEWQEELWGPGYPGNGREDCGALEPNGEVASLVCDLALSYICEISPKGFDLTEANPSGLAATSTSTGLEVTWVVSSVSCDVVGYRVTYGLAQDGADTSFVIVYGGDTNSATIDDVVRGSTYSVTVNAVLSQDYELSPIDPVLVTFGIPIMLVCSATTMSVSIPLSRLGGAMAGSDLELLNDPRCQGVLSQEDQAIVITTNLTGCNNEIKEVAGQELYSNTVVEREYGVVTRVSDVFVPFTCAYNRSARVGMRSYELQNYKVNSSQEATGKYAFALDIYRDGEFADKYSEEEYPVDMELNEELYFGASVPSQGGTLDLAITRCVATPSDSYNDDQYVIIDNGCATEQSTLINPDNLDFVGVTMTTFRFVGLGSRVYIHCDLLVCEATSGRPTECSNITCQAGPSGSQRRIVRRDVSAASTLARKRMTRGPIRFRRSAAIDDVLDLQDVNTPASNFNPWMLAAVTMVIVLAVLIGGVIFGVRKVTSAITAQRKLTKDDEAAVPLMEG
ncbi:scavenger receptor cysteine-rich domain-containing protein DMBT1-like [Diadema setosum]|uniref:scavenger receptor cysteine-rich domain-containing protein DMBT1-like n=1 Tax=Diadema setosum TaxID=31175 RepID=UPI003B3B5C4C